MTSLLDSAPRRGDSATKTCFKCGQEKPVDEFYRHNMMADGRLGKCKVCTRIDIRKNRLSKIEYYREYDRRRYEENGSRARPRDYEKVRAIHVVSRAIKQGDLVRRECEICGEDNVDAHHEDYSKPLDVVWMCRKHHMRLHGGQFSIWPGPF